jgi:hypothetical protein
MRIVNSTLRTLSGSGDVGAVEFLTRGRKAP